MMLGCNSTFPAPFGKTRSSSLCLEQYPGDRGAERFVPVTAAAHDFHFPAHERGGWQGVPQPSTRAAIVLSAVGCDWRDGGR
jgi:hypothetical protein